MLKSIGYFFLDSIGVLIQVGIIFGVHYLMNGFKMPEYEDLIFGIAFLALFNTVTNARKISNLS